ncbi:MAG: DUF2092 domain-containing protein [Candidatus Polarisedimenticolia bacterium]
MKFRAYLGTVLVLTLLALPTGTPAQQTPDLDPDAMKALNTMGAYLRSLKVYRVQSVHTLDEVLDDGQVVTFGETADVLVQSPNRLLADVSSDRKSRMFFYDGKTFTLYARRMDYYATAPAPATVRQLVDTLDQRYGIELPLVDLILWGTDDNAPAQIRSARDLGPSAIDGTSCRHYAYRQEGLDWQLWLQLGPSPLPRKLILTTLTDDARPRYSSVFHWDLAPAFNAEAFTFIPPADAKKIVFAKTGPKTAPSVTGSP